MWDHPAATNTADRADAEATFERALRSQLGNCNLPGETEATERVAATWQRYRTAYDAFDAAPPPERPDRYPVPTTANDFLRERLREIKLI